MNKCGITIELDYEKCIIIKRCPNKGVWKHPRYENLFCNIHKKAFELAIPDRWEKVNENLRQSK